MLSTLRLTFFVCCWIAFWGNAAFAQHTRPQAHAVPSTRLRGVRGRRIEEARPTLALQTGHSGWVISIAFSPDGRLAATGSEDKTVRIWNVRTGEMLTTLQGHTARVETIRFSPDGRLLATLSQGGDRIRLWDPRRGRLLATVRAGQMLFNIALAFSPDSRKLAVVGFDERIYFWNLRTFQREGFYAHSSDIESINTPQALAFSPDGTRLAVGGEAPPFQANFQRGAVTLLDVRTLKPLRKLICREPVTRLTFAMDGRSLLTGSSSWALDARVTEAHLWDLGTGRVHPEWRHALQNVIPGVFNVAAGGAVAAFGNIPAPGYVRTVDLRTGRVQRQWKALSRPVDRIILSADGRRLAAFGWGEPGSIWDLVLGARVADIPDLRAWMAPEVTFSPDGHQIAAAGGSNDARIWNANNGRLAVDLRGHLGSVQSFVIAPDGDTVAAGCEDQFVRLWSPRTGRLRTTLTFPEPVTAVAYAPDGRLLAATGGHTTDSGRLGVWDVATGVQRADLTLRWTGYALTFSPDSRHLAIGPISQEVYGVRYSKGDSIGIQSHFGSGDQKGGYLWNTAEGTRCTTLPNQPDAITQLLFSPDSTRLAIGSDSSSTAPIDQRTRAEVQLYDVTAGHLDETLMWLGTAPLTIAYSPDGRTIATGSNVPGKAPAGLLWDSGRAKPRAALETTGFPPSGRPMHRPGVVVALVYSPDGSLLAGSVAGEVRLWNPANGRLIGILDEPRDFVKDLAFSPDGRLLVTASEERRARIWNVVARRQIPLVNWEQLASFPARFRYALSTEGAALLLHDTRDGRVLARMIPIPPPVLPERIPGGPPADSSDLWFTVTPEGYFDGSPDAARYIKWNVNGVLYPAERYLRRFRRPDLVSMALRGEKIQAAPLSAGDVPPSVRIVGFKDGDAAVTDPLKVTVETHSLHRVKQVEIYVNGRPLSPGEARPIESDARPIEADARPIEADARQPEMSVRYLQHFSFRVSLPQGASDIHLRAIAYDETDLGSDPAEVVLHRAGLQEVTGNLYVLSIGIGHYQHGGGTADSSRGQFRNLRYPAADAQAIAARLRQEGRPLYEHVEVHSLTDAEATRDSIREGIRWLQESVGPGQIDTVVLYLSGHGYSTPDGHYYFAPFDFDVRAAERTGLAGSELREALGGRLRARRVFLFVDTCHSGGLSGRSEDLAASLGEGVFIVASSAANEYAYESEAWGHGAFTLGLLRSLNKPELEDNGAIRFADLISSLRREVAILLRQSGRNDTEQEPCVPLAGRRLGEPVVHAHR